MPVWSTGTTPHYASQSELVPWAYDVPVAVGGALCMPGDLVVADDDPAVMSTWWRSFRLNLRQSLAWWLPVLVLVALSAWEYLLLSDSSLGENNGGVSGSLSGLVLAWWGFTGLTVAAGLLSAALLVWVLRARSRYENDDEASPISDTVTS